MPPLPRRYLATAALFLVAGMALGLWLLARRELAGRWPEPSLVTAHAHLLLVGTVLETILGTALWLFPRPARDDPRHRAWRAEAAWWSLTAGTVLRSGGDAAHAWVSGAWLGGVVVSGAALQVTGLVLGLLALRPRVLRPRAIEASRPGM